MKYEFMGFPTAEQVKMWNKLQLMTVLYGNPDSIREFPHCGICGKLRSCRVVGLSDEKSLISFYEFRSTTKKRNIKYGRGVAAPMHICNNFTKTNG